MSSSEDCYGKCDVFNFYFVDKFKGDRVNRLSNKFNLKVKF